MSNVNIRRHSSVATAAQLVLKEIQPETSYDTVSHASAFLRDSVNVVGQHPNTIQLKTQMDQLKELRTQKLKVAQTGSAKNGVEIGFLASLAALDPSSAAALAGCSKE